MPPSKAEAHRRNWAAIGAALSEEEGRGEPERLDPLARLAHLLFQHLAGPLIAFAAQRVLRERGVASKVVAGAAAWSPGLGDILRRSGVAASGKSGWPRSCDFHTWLLVEGRIVDFAARYLHNEFGEAHRHVPFVTESFRWHTFPHTLVHPAGAPMPSPSSDRGGAYSYEAGGPSLLRAVCRRLTLILQCPGAFDPGPAGKPDVFATVGDVKDPLAALIDLLRRTSIVGSWRVLETEGGFCVSAPRPGGIRIRNMSDCFESGASGALEVYMVLGYRDHDALVFSEHEGRIVFDAERTVVVRDLVSKA